jgi:DNA-binding LytR/AlgR family response regulator
MAKMKILVVEDEMIIADSICLNLEDLGYEVLEPAINYPEAVELLEEEKPDIAILDVQLSGKQDGIDLAETINKDFSIPFIFLTSNSDATTLERAKKVNPHAFLVKPFKKEDLYTSIELALHSYAKNKQDDKSLEENVLIKDAIFVKEKNLFWKVPFSQILFLKSDHVYIQIVLVNGKEHLVRGSLNKLVSRLPANFYQTNRSYAINLDRMEAINSNFVLVNGKQIPLGKSYRDTLLNGVKVE